MSRFPIPAMPERIPQCSVSCLGLAWPSRRDRATDTKPVDGRAGPGPRPHSAADYGDARGPPSNLQNFYANQRHQSSRGSNEAEQMLQAKRRMAAQRERELRNYHQEQQYNRSRPPSTV